MSEQRRLAAILVADVVGYSKLIGSDETGTLAQLQVLRSEIIEPQIAKHVGRLFKSVGGWFPSRVRQRGSGDDGRAGHPAGQCGGSLQLRIGIHVGDVVVQGDDLMGDGVNVAARVESVSEPGGVAITRAVHEQVRDKLDLVFIDRGEIELKNIARPVQVFVVGGAKVSSVPAALPLPNKPSIAVLPLQNMSGDPEQEYFADGMVEDIITALSRFKSLFVIDSRLVKPACQDAPAPGELMPSQRSPARSTPWSVNALRRRPRPISSLGGTPDNGKITVKIAGRESCGIFPRILY